MRMNRIPFAVPALAGAVLFLGAFGCAPPPPGTFATPEEAVQAISDIAGLGDPKKVEEVFGPEGPEILSSGDEVADKADGEKVKALIAEKVGFEDGPDGTRIAVFGNDEWPFPIPLIQEGKRWKFDVAAGKEEILNRRIGRNELSTLATLHELVEAQREYSSEGRDGNPPAFAQKIRSDEGKKNGLYWAVAEGEPPSPLGPLMAEATTQGYEASQEGPIPYHGYYYRLLTAQGKNAPGGEKSYLDKKGLMTGGFAAVAWPAKHGNSGVMTFLVTNRGIVYQKDLGADTETAVQAMTAFDPDATWTPTGD